ncbi:hypothetical protein [Paenibacillus cremeus]|uniref:Uncharacterized protein n=1 Tax=Paenibacillus cremeus TaxID=2163881 RepID=A0A559KCF6_9BACL|nr:hypothetical protein [Paenibacillus cremeus]TVY09817.1 hypothetical protein FPZ49_10605 [Paenibacillus cremeus]
MNDEVFKNYIRLKKWTQHLEEENKKLKDENAILKGWVVGLKNGMRELQSQIEADKSMGKGC